MSRFDHLIPESFDMLHDRMVKFEQQYPNQSSAGLTREEHFSDIIRWFKKRSLPLHVQISGLGPVNVYGYNEREGGLHIKVAYTDDAGQEHRQDYPIKDVQNIDDKYLKQYRDGSEETRWPDQRNEFPDDVDLSN